MFCTKCGTRNDESARFCVSCGASTIAGSEAGIAAAIPAPRRLRRIRSQKKLAGVCAGFAEYFDMDLTLVRVIWLATCLVPPSIGVIGYIIAWAVLPAE